MTVWIQNPFDNLPCEGFRKQRFWLMSEAFAAAGHRVVLWTSDFSHLKKAKRTLAAPPGGPLGPGSLEVRLIPTLPYAKNVGFARLRSHRAYAKTWRKLAALAPAPDLIVTSIPSISAAAAALRIGRACGAKVVVDVMDAWPETFVRLAPKGLRWLARLLLLPLARTARRLYREADLVTGVCARYRDLTGRADYHLAYHGVELRPSRALPARPGAAVRLVYAGTLGRTYDLDTVLKAVAENPDFTLDVAGRWTGPVPDRVTVHGYLGQDDLERLLDACDVGVIPMSPDSWVGMPYKICDYAMAGLRVVSSLGGESSALLDEFRCGATYRAGDSASLADAVRRAMSLPRGASRKLCEERLDAHRIYADYVRKVVAFSIPCLLSFALT